VLVGIGDDAAVVSLEPGSDLIACCDLVVEGVHFRAGWAAPKLLGHKALAVTLSDVAAMGAIARFAMVSIALPPSTKSEFVDDLFRGIVDLADQCGVSIIGGDTSSSPGPLFLDTSVIGECARGRAVTRGGAKAGDIIYVTGDLGASALGLRLLEAGHRLEDELSDDRSQARRRALLKHLAPEPRLKLGQAIGEAGLATAMIDISDGLSTDLWHVLEESGCGAIIHAASLPIAECTLSLSASDSRFDSLSLALHGGEEYELLFTSLPESEGELLELSISMGVAITSIGEILPGSGLQLERDKRTETVLPAGYEHRT
jgi:thiamine-monophosphate kinase